MRILLVEDEVRLSQALVEIFQKNKFGVDAVYTGTDGLEYAQSGVYDVIILDIMLPGMDGISVLKKLRAERNQVPVMLLSAKDDVSDKVKGLDMGADDYVVRDGRSAGAHSCPRPPPRRCKGRFGNGRRFDFEREKLRASVSNKRRVGEIVAQGIPDY